MSYTLWWGMKLFSWVVLSVLVVISALAIWWFDIRSAVDVAPARTVTSLSIDERRALQLAYAAHALFDDKLADYPSARFKNVHATHYYLGIQNFEVQQHKRRTTELSSYVLCGLLNVKNAFGAYIGWLPFAVDNGDVHVAFPTAINETYIVASLCTGRGDGAEMALRSIEASKTIVQVALRFSPSYLDPTQPNPPAVDQQVTRESQEEGDAQQQLKDNSFPILPHSDDLKTDYSKEIAFAPAKT